MMHSPSHLIFYIYSVRVCLLFLRDVSNIIFSLGVKVFAFSPGGTNFAGFINVFRLLSLKSLNYDTTYIMHVVYPEEGLVSSATVRRLSLLRATESSPFGL